MELQINSCNGVNFSLKWNCFINLTPNFRNKATQIWEVLIAPEASFHSSKCAKIVSAPLDVEKWGGWDGEGREGEGQWRIGGPLGHDLLWQKMCFSP